MVSRWKHLKYEEQGYNGFTVDKTPIDEENKERIKVSIIVDTSGKLSLWLFLSERNQ